MKLWQKIRCFVGWHKYEDNIGFNGIPSGKEIPLKFFEECIYCHKTRKYVEVTAKTKENPSEMNLGEVIKKMKEENET